MNSDPLPPPASRSVSKSRRALNLAKRVLLSSPTKIEMLLMEEAAGGSVRFWDLGGLTGPWSWCPLVWITNKAETSASPGGSGTPHSEGTPPTPSLRNSAWRLAQCFWNMATSQNHLEALNKPEWVQPAGQWVAWPLLPKLPRGPPGESCLHRARQQGGPDGDTGGAAPRHESRTALGEWPRARASGARLPQPLPADHPPPTGRAMGRLLWPLALPPWLHTPVQPAGVGWPRHPFKCLLAAWTFNLSLLGRM